VGRPAARKTDIHVCPRPIHIGGPILPPCATTVLIDGLPAARETDTCECDGPIDVIRKGDATVLIEGKPAARKGDPTVHRGRIITGSPTVEIGDYQLKSKKDGLFGDENLESLIGQTYEGADSEELANAMDTLWDKRDDPDHPDVATALEAIAKARNRPLDEIQREFEVYNAELAKQEQAREESDLGRIHGVPFWQDEFMGSTSQLRSGKLVGEALGMDPVFGALLNPTGGLVGPGRLGADLDDSATGYHGAVHDAAGYLYNYHGYGPGYDYLGLDGRDMSSALSGQGVGIDYWSERVDGLDFRTQYFDSVRANEVQSFVDTVDGASEAWNSLWN
jgi:uncharacterized Zn-binding protein involved in type VI secretion